MSHLSTVDQVLCSGHRVYGERSLTLAYPTSVGCLIFLPALSPSAASAARAARSAQCMRAPRHSSTFLALQFPGICVRGISRLVRHSVYLERARVHERYGAFRYPSPIRMPCAPNHSVCLSPPCIFTLKCAPDFRRPIARFHLRALNATPCTCKREL